ncbi:beta-1,4-galactosyltransferase galt-1-like [Pecten maximus]|uniref:beta-1,4-galactosyltransferase galt-1-like n=1 Tax=Pecten maximus TaxID=6579 RepID=UPI001457FEBD|nr:beta-1,4-galactosyltransferase galt-1-like [Pecten maximus]
MLSRRIGRCLVVLLTVYLTVTVYIACTMLTSTSTSVADLDYGSSELDDKYMSKHKKNLVDKKYQLFRIRNPKFSPNDYGNVKQQEIPTTKWTSVIHRITPEVVSYLSVTKNVNVYSNLEEWKEKMDSLRHKHVGNGNSTNLHHFQKFKQLMVNFKDDNTKKLLNKSNTEIDLRRGSRDSNAILPTYHVNLVSLPGEIRVYSAYLDERKPTRFIRIVLIGKRAETNKDIVCKFLLRDLSNNTVVSRVTLYETCESHMKYFSSFIGSCEVPSIDVLLDQVVLSVSNTDIFMNVIDNDKKGKIEPQDLAICVPPLFGDVDILRLTEFIELSRILGAQHFVFYPKFISSEVSTLLDYYRRLGLATVMVWNLTAPVNAIWYHGQSASVWDCLYRTMFTFKHVAFLDFDEFIVPRNQNTIPDFLSYLHEEQGVDDETISAYKFKSAFFDSKFNSDDVVELSELRQLTTLNNTVRTRKFSNIRTKLIVNPVNVFELGIHHVSKPNEEHYQCHNVSPKLAFIHHYRHCKSDYGMNCKLTVKDTSVTTYKTSLVRRVKQRLFDVSLYNSTDVTLHK